MNVIANHINKMQDGLDTMAGDAAKFKLYFICWKGKVLEVIVKLKDVRIWLMELRERKYYNLLFF